MGAHTRFHQFQGVQGKQKEIMMLDCQDWSLDGAVLTKPLHIQHLCICFPRKLHLPDRLMEDKRLKGKSVHLSGHNIRSKMCVLYLLNWNFWRGTLNISSALGCVTPLPWDNLHQWTCTTVSNSLQRPNADTSLNVWSYVDVMLLQKD